MIVRIITTLSIALSCSESNFDSGTTPLPKTTSTAEVNKEETGVSTELLPANESGSVVASKVWEEQGKPLVDSDATIEGEMVTTKRTMGYQINNGKTEKTQFNRVQSFVHPWQDREEERDDGRQSYRQGVTIVERPLDVLLVVDISGSMSDERRGLGTRLSKLLQHIEDSEWRLAITTTYAEQCLLKKWIIPKETGGFFRDKNDFNAIISGDNNSGDNGEINEYHQHGGEIDNERPILMAINGLGGNMVKEKDDHNPDMNSWCRGRQRNRAQ